MNLGRPSRIAVWLCGLILCLSSSRAYAQERRPGDFYFADPDIAIAEGSTAEVELMAYLGAQEFGAFAVRLVYPSAELNASGVSFGNTALLQSVLVNDAKDGQLGLLGLAEGSDLLIGEISLAKVTLAPEVLAGSVIQVQIQILSLYDRSGSEFFQTNAGVLNITVTSGDPQGPAADPDGEAPLVEATAAEWELIRQLWRPAGVVQIMRSYWLNRRLYAYPVRVDASILAYY
jgi:hypothetical protein